MRFHKAKSHTISGFMLTGALGAKFGHCRQMEQSIVSEELVLAIITFKLVLRNACSMELCMAVMIF